MYFLLLNKTTVKNQSAGYLLLYFFYFLFFISVFLFVESNVGNGAVALITIVTILIFILNSPRSYRQRSNFGEPFIDKWHLGQIIFIIIIVSISLFVLLGATFKQFSLTTSRQYSLLFYVEIIFLIFLFRICRVKISQFINFINITYLIYLFTSVLFWLISFKLRPEVNAFRIDLIWFDFITLYGIEGSTASIDSYSGLILIINLILNQSVYKKRMIIISSIALFLAFRSTPVCALMISLFIMHTGIINNSKRAVYITVLPLIIICLILYILTRDSGYISFFGNEVNLFSLAYNASHARTMIWQEQLSHLFYSYDFLDYILGSFDDGFKVLLYTIDKGIIQKMSNNAHNSYFMLFYRSPVLSIALYVTTIIAISKTFNKKTFPVIMFIMLTSLTNSTLFSLQNPVYIFTLLFLFVTDFNCEQTS